MKAFLHLLATCYLANLFQAEYTSYDSLNLGMTYVIHLVNQLLFCDRRSRRERPAVMKKLSAFKSKLLNCYMLPVTSAFCMHVTELSRSDKRYLAENSQHNLTEPMWNGPFIAAAANPKLPTIL